MTEYKSSRRVATMLAAALFATGSATATAYAADEGDNEQGGACAPVHVLIAPGTSETSSWSDPNDDRHGYLSSLIKPVLAAANDGRISDLSDGFSSIISEEASGREDPDNDRGELVVARTTITYPSTAGGAAMPGMSKNLGDMTSYSDSVATGVGMTETMIKQINDSCPDTDIIGVGYSQGAEVMSATARRAGAGESDIDTDSIAGFALVADPTREGGTPLMVDGSDGPAGQSAVSGLSQYPTPKADGLSPEKTGYSDFGTLENRVFSPCLPGDYVCGLPADSPLVAEIVAKAEELTLGDPVEALTQVANAMDRAAKVTDFSEVADLDFGEHGFKAAGLTDHENTELDHSVIAERFRTNLAGTDRELTDDSDLSSPHEDDDSATGNTASEALPGQGDSTETTDTDPYVSDDATDEDSSWGSTSTGTDASESADATSIDKEDSATSSLESSESSESTEATEEVEDTELLTEESAEPATDVAEQPTEAVQPGPPAVDPLSSPEAFAGAVIPLANKLGGMALGTTVTWVKDTLTPQNLADIALAGVTGGPQAAGVAAGVKFAETGKTLLEPASVSGKARDVLTAVEESGFTVPEQMKLAVELSSWLSMTEHVAYGERAMLPDGRTAEEAIQDWILDIAGTDSSSADLDDTIDGLVTAGTEALDSVEFDPQMATDALDTVRKVAQ